MTEDLADRLSETELRIRDSQAWQYAQRYAAGNTPWFTQVQFRLLKRLLSVERSDVVLDLGCGPGRLTLLLAPLCRRIIAVDRSAASLEVLRRGIEDRKLQNVVLTKADITMPFHLEEKVTKTLSVEVIQHIPGVERRRRALENARKLTVDDGACVFLNLAHGLGPILTGMRQDNLQPDGLYYHMYGGRDLRADLFAAGFKRVRTTGCGVLSWVGYERAPMLLPLLDPWISRVPGVKVAAKFIVAVAT